MAVKVRKSKKKGAIRKTRTDTHIETIEKTYGQDYGVKSDINLGTYLRKNGYNSLSVLLKNGKK